MKQRKLNEIDKVKVPFQVPEGYFESLEHKIQAQTTGAETHKRTQISWTWKLAPALGVLLILTYWVFLRPVDNQPKDYLAEVPTEDMIAYLDYSELTIEDITSLTSSPEDLLEDLQEMEQFDMEDELIDELIDDYDLDEEILYKI